MATSSLRLKLLKLEIQWGGPGSSSDKPMPSTARLNPALVETRLASTNWLHSSANEASADATMSQLSHMHVLPSLLDSTGKTTVPPMIVTIRSRESVEGPYQAAQSILDRWEAVEQRQNLHPAFERLGARRNSVSSDLASTTKLHKLEPIVIDKVVVGFQVMPYGKVVVLTMYDGSVEYRSRFTFEEIYATEDMNKVMNLRQVGWTFTEEGPCTYRQPPGEEDAPLTAGRPASCLFADILLDDPKGRRRQDSVEKAALSRRRHWQLDARRYALGCDEGARPG